MLGLELPTNQRACYEADGTSNQAREHHTACPGVLANPVGSPHSGYPPNGHGTDDTPD